MTSIVERDRLNDNILDKVDDLKQRIALLERYALTATIQCEPTGTGDMFKSVYDTDDNGVVDDAEHAEDSDALGGVSASDYLTETEHTAIGDGSPHHARYTDSEAVAAMIAAGVVTSVSGSTPIASSGGQTPAISLNAAGVTNAYLAYMANQTIKGRLTTGSGAPEDLSAAQVISILTTADGSGSGLDADMLDGQHAAAFATASHAIIASHTVTGSQYSVVGLSAANTLGVLTTAYNPGPAVSILRTHTDGGVILEKLSLAEYTYHADDADTYSRFQPDQWSLVCGGVTLINAVEATYDYVDFPAGITVGSPTPAGYRVHINAPVTASDQIQFRIDDGTTGGYFAIQEESSVENAYFPGIMMSSIGVAGAGSAITGELPSGQDSYLWNGAGIILRARRTSGGALTSANILIIRNDTDVGVTVTATAQMSIGWNLYPDGQLHVDQSESAGEIPVLVLDQGDADQPFIDFRSGTVYTSRSAADEYLMVKNPSGSTRYIRLYS